MRRFSKIFWLIVFICIFASTSFAIELKYNTERRIAAGPFVDITDGLTPETSVTLSAMDECELILPHSTGSQPAHSLVWTAATNADGWYSITLAGDSLTNYGNHTLVFHDDNVFLPVFVTFEVVSVNYWDTKYGTDVLQADVTHIAGAAVAVGTAQLGVNVVNYGGDAVTDTVAGIPDVNVTYWEDTAVPADANGTPDVNVTLIEGGDATDALDAAADTVTVTSVGAGVITDAACADDIKVDVKTIETGDATDALDAAADTVTVTAFSTWPDVNVVQYSGDSTTAYPDVNVVRYSGNSTVATVSGLPDVNVTYWEDSAVSDSDGTPDVDTTLIEGADPTDMIYSGSSVVTVTAIGTDVITATSIQANAIGDAELNADVDTLVNDEVKDVLNTDTISEMAQGAPSATPTMQSALNYLYRGFRNKIVTSSSSITYYDNAGTTILFKSQISDDGTVFTRDEMETGP